MRVCIRAVLWVQVPVRTMAPQVYEARELPSFVLKKKDAPPLENMFEVRTTKL